MVRRLLVIIDHPHRSVAALDLRTKELLPDDVGVSASADYSFQPNLRIATIRRLRLSASSAQPIHARDRYFGSTGQLSH